MTRWAGAVLGCAIGVLAAAGATGSGPLPDAAEGGADAAAGLVRLQQEVDARRARVEAFATREQGLLDTLEAADQAAARIAREVLAARREAGAAEAALAAAARKAEQTEADYRRTQRALSLRLAQLYREGRVGGVRLLAAAASLPDLLARGRSLRRAAERDAALAARARSDREALARARREAEASRRASAEAVRRLAARALSLDDERAAKQDLLASLRSDGARERAALTEIEAAARALEETLSRLGAVAPRRPPPAEPFAGLRGRLRAPVAAPVARRFGKVVDAQFRTATFRKGIDFAAPVGASVRSVAGGEVRFAGWFRGYGKMVIVDHGETYYTVLAHLDQIDVAVGDRVSADQPIGTVGDTGSLAGPLLYFEIRHGNEPLDPARWLAGGTGLE